MTIHRSFAGVHTWYLNRVALRLGRAPERQRNIQTIAHRRRRPCSRPPAYAGGATRGRPADHRRGSWRHSGPATARARLATSTFPEREQQPASKRSVSPSHHESHTYPYRFTPREQNRSWMASRPRIQAVATPSIAKSRITPIDVESALAKNGDFNWYVAPAVAGGSGVEPGTPGHRVRVHGAIRRAQTAPPPGRGFLLAALNKKVAGSQRPACTRPSVCDLQSSGRHVIRTG